MHILISRLHLHLSVHGHHAPHARAGFDGTVTSDRRFQVPEDGRHHDASLLAQSPFVANAERFGRHKCSHQPFAFLCRLAFRLRGQPLQVVSHLRFNLTHGMDYHRPVHIVLHFPQPHLDGLSRPRASFCMIAVSCVVHYQQRVVFKHPQQPIHPALVAVQQAHHIARRHHRHPLPDAFLRFAAKGQRQVQPGFAVPRLGREGLDLIQLLGPRTQMSADVSHLEVAEAHEFRHLGIERPVLHVNEKLPAVAGSQKPVRGKFQLLECPHHDFRLPP